MLTHRILNAHFQYLKCLFTSFLMHIYNIFKNIQWTCPFRDDLLKRRLSQE